jgi:transposase
MKTGVISLTREQHDRLDTINKANAGYMTVSEAAERLGISERQVQRLKREVKENGPAALIHKNTNRAPSNAITDELKAKILKIRKKPGYKDANFNHFKELLEEHHEISISYSALHRMLTADGQKSPKKRRRFKKHRRRKRREQAGELIQIDASPHDWLGNGTTMALHGCIDDATGQITGLYLCKNECMLGYYEVMRRTIGVFGVPDSIYADRHTIFRSPNADKAKAADVPPGMKANETQFGRAMSELRIKIIAARSPQAKGRIERLWGTLQSRLPVELEIAGIKDADAANAFLASYVFAYNSEFAVEPEDSESAFLPLEDGQVLDHILCVKEQRQLDSGQEFSYDGKRFQIEKSAYSSWLPPKAGITVMVSPQIGIKAAYKNLVFETKPAEKKPKKTKPLENESAAKPAADSIVYRSEYAWNPKDGLQWRPGLPSYKEVFEIVQNIFEKPYGDPKKRNRASMATSTPANRQPSGMTGGEV